MYDLSKLSECSILDPPTTVLEPFLNELQALLDLFSLFLLQQLYDLSRLLQAHLPHSPDLVLGELNKQRVHTRQEVCIIYMLGYGQEGRDKELLYLEEDVLLIGR